MISKLLILPILIFLSAGCTHLFDQTAAEEALKKREEKKGNFATLRQQIISRSLAYGTTTNEISDRFGEPDDIFESSSNISSFEVWTYEEVLEPKEGPGYSPIRLYFNDHKLVSWNH